MHLLLNKDRTLRVAFPVVEVGAVSAVRQVSAKHGVVDIVGSKGQTQGLSGGYQVNTHRELEREKTYGCLLGEFHDIN